MSQMEILMIMKRNLAHGVADHTVHRPCSRKLPRKFQIPGQSSSVWVCGLLRDAERESQFFAELPAADMFAVSQLVLDAALVDLAHADRVKSLIKDLWDIRCGHRCFA